MIASEQQSRDIEPRWPAMLAVLSIGALHFALPSHLSLGPDWLLLVLVSVLLIPAVILHRRGEHTLNQVLGYVILAVVTLDLIASLTLLLAGLPSHRDSPQVLLVSAAGLWAVNILVFASWYWRLDAGGPNERDARGVHSCGAFLFPQMALDPELKAAVAARHWRPGFIDYLFLAFNTSTAFSPTDVPVLSRWAKLMMMVQASISLGTVIILAARAVNVL
ncbi:MAG TPA: hypothetical protein VKV15_27570 [Bryobacteraceae bacterium]|nr:hypothetical protein [Bryobacteraceae bacterium]